MRRARRVSLVVVLFLLASTGTAFAECAWVLWNSWNGAELPDQAPYVVTAYPTMKECEAELAEEFARQKRDGWQVSYVHVRTIVGFKGKGEKMIMHNRCLPDTVDPREPKAK